MTGPRVASVLLGCLVFAFGTACLGEGGGTTLSARFDDVGDLAEDAPVMMADITVGKVEDIRLAGDEALVTMTIDENVKIPAGAVARVRRTSVLGERIVDLAPSEGDALSTTGPYLKDGDEISETVVRSDLEDLVAEGSDLLGALSAADLATMIDEGARGFGGSGEELRGLLANYKEIISAYAAKGEQIKDLISSADNFNRTVAAQASAHELAVANTDRSIEVLNEESHRLERAIVALNRLAVSGSAILDEHTDEMIRFFQQTRVILGVLDDEQSSIRHMLEWAPGHNLNTQLVEYVEFNQIVQDFVICGLNDNPNDPARRCFGEEG